MMTMTVMILLLLFTL